MSTILHVIGNMNRGGAETFLMNVLREIDRDSYKFIFLCYGNSASLQDYSDEIIKLGAKIVYIPDVKSVGIKQHIEDLMDIMTKFKVTGLHAHTYYNSVFSIIAAKRSGIHLRIVHSHSTQPDTQATTIQKKIYYTLSRATIKLLATKRIACSSDAATALYGNSKGAIVINNGIRVRDYTFSMNARNKTRKELGINDTDIVVLHVGRFHKVKNHTYLLRVFAKFREININSKLILAGEGPTEKDVRSNVDRLNLADSVIFTGLRSDTMNLYSASDVFIMPSLYEGIPIVLIEAQSNGLACIISDTIDSGVKLIETVHFKSLTESPEKWARKMSEICSIRIRKESETLSGTAYDMTVGIDKIYKLYDGIT